ncbi:unnamed protein product [Eruca vesicaria subsp. sativa]|uniref:Fungal lipase-type domain-containing protein n=1 Tax=Eruca vesicaria subsp. sativa TaxID=29727 RepID=A0ABC8JMF5_ERUVS|nr:unnamed protein product [Eruca vesicaria subsp. sativa]
MGGGGKGDDFNNVGPKYLTCVDWSNSNHRTAVASCLVQGVYSLQRDKIKKRKSEAHLWWESFDFSLAEPLINKDDNSIYGAVFEYKNYQKNIPHSGKPPSHVIAFRGTMLKFKTWYKDLKQDIRCLFNNLNKGSRCKHATQTIETVLKKHSTDEKVSVWLAGHSLGAGIALLAAKTMTKRGFPLETYAFNPPNSSLPLEKLSDIDVFKRVFRFSESFFKGTIAVFSHNKTQQHDPRLAAWTPYVYVNPSDIVCAEYVGDVKHKNFMVDFGLGKIESVGAGISLRSLIFGIERAEPIQHLLSADITVNKNKLNVVETDNVLKKCWYEFKKAHGLAQWWEPNPTLRANWETHSIRPSNLCLEMESSSST